MPSRNWLLITAIGGWLAWIGVSPYQAAHAQEDDSPTRIERALETMAEAIRNFVDGEEDNKPCDKGADDRKSDLCAQWKAADAAKENARWAWWQLWIGAAGVSAVAASLYFTIKATSAAAKASVAAEKSAEAILKLERAYLFVRGQPKIDIGHMEREINNRRNVDLKFTVYLDNVGKTPAIIKQYSCIAAHYTDLGTPSFNNTLEVEAVIMPEKHYGPKEAIASIQIDRNALNNVIAGHSFFFCYGQVIYEDVFGHEHETRWWVRYDGRFGKVSPYGGKEWNYRT